MRVLYLAGGGVLGGAERSLLDVLASVRAAEPSWTLRLMTGIGGPLTERAAVLGVSTAVLPFPAALSRLGEAGVEPIRGLTLGLLAGIVRSSVPVARYVKALRAAVSDFGPDLLHTTSLKMHVLGAWARPPATAVVWHLHDYVRPRPLTSRLLKLNARRCDAVVANSESVAADARTVLGGATDVTAILNAVDLDRFTPLGAQLDLDALAGLPPAPAGVVRVGLLGAFGRWKGHTTFLDALARLPGDVSVRGYVIGDALYRTVGSQFSLDDLRRCAVSRGLNGSVGFTGFVADPDRAMRALDVVVHASTAPEPFGLVIAEAMACGRPVIAADAGGAREIFAAGVDALPHVPGDADSLAGCIAALARDTSARLRMGAAGRRRAEQCFDRSRLARELVPLYARAVHARAAS